MPLPSSPWAHSRMASACVCVGGGWRIRGGMTAALAEGAWDIVPARIATWPLTHSPLSLCSAPAGYKCPSSLSLVRAARKRLSRRSTQAPLISSAGITSTTSRSGGRPMPSPPVQVLTTGFSGRNHRSRKPVRAFRSFESSNLSLSVFWSLLPGLADAECGALILRRVLPRSPDFLDERRVSCAMWSAGGEGSTSLRCTRRSPP
jgi:hypothetical protein